MKWREEGEVRMMRAISTLTSWMRYHSGAGLIWRGGGHRGAGFHERIPGFWCFW